MQSDNVVSSSENIVIRVRLQDEYRFLIMDVNSFSLDGFMCAGKLKLAFEPTYIISINKYF